MRKRRWILLLSAFFLLVIVGVALAAPTYLDISWWTVDGGGGRCQGGNYVVSGTIGQPDASPLMHGGSFIVSGGFWGGNLLIEPTYLVYLPLVVR